MALHSACERLRAVVQDALAKHLYGSAVFYGDKLVALSKGDPADVYLLAQAFFVSKQHKRALALIQHDRYLDADVRFRCAELANALSFYVAQVGGASSAFPFQMAASAPAVH